MDKTKILETIAAALDAVKNFSKYLIIPVGVLTFFPDDWLSYIRLLDLKNVLGPWTAGVFFISLSIVTIDILSKVTKSVSKKRKAKQTLKNLEKTLLNLTETEKSILNVIYTQDHAEFPYNNASISKLERLYIVTRPNISVGHINFSYTLQPWVQEYLHKHPEYFKEVSSSQMISDR